MSTLLKPREQFAALNEVFDLDRFSANPLFRDVFGKTFPAVNIRETDKNFSIDFSVPGFAKDNFKIAIHGDQLIVTGSAKEESKEEKDSYMRREFQYRSFSRSFILPESADMEKTEAKYENGILHVTVAKREEVKRDRKKDISVQ